MVTWDNYEEYLVMQADGELDAAAEAALEAFLQAHPELREEQAIYAKLHLEPDTNVVFGAKESLMREEPGRKVIALGNWRQYSAAAGILLLVAIGLMTWNKEETTTIGKVEDTTVHANTPQVAIIDTATLVKEEQVAIKEEQPAPQPALQPTQRKVQVAVVRERQELPKVDLPERVETSNIATLATAEIQKPVAEPTDIPELPQIIAPAPEPYREALAWLPVSEERKQGLTEIKNAVERRFEKVKEVSNSFKNTDVAVKLGKKELFTIRF